MNRDINESCRKILESIMSYKVANEFTWSGRAKIGGGKLVFDSLHNLVVSCITY